LNEWEISEREKKMEIMNKLKPFKKAFENGREQQTKTACSIQDI
jgi:hypothetical protein